MEGIKKFINRFGAFIWWVLQAILCLIALICCVSQAAAGIGVFWAACGSMGCMLSLIIFAWTAYAEWLEKDDY